MGEISRFVLAWFASLCVAGGLTPALAQEPSPPAPPAALSEELRGDLQSRLDAIDQRRQEVAVIESRIAEADGLMLEILNIRLDQDQIALLTDGVAFARAVDTRQDTGFAVEDFRARAVEVLQSNVATGIATWNRVTSRVAVPETTGSAIEQAAADAEFFALQRSIDRVIALMADSIELLGEFSVDITGLEAEFQQRLAERAINASVYLDLAQRDATAIRAGLAALPGDAELTARLTVANSRITRTSVSLESVVDELADYGANVSRYRQQLIAATGEITPELFDFTVIGDLASQWGNALLSWLGEEGPAMLFRLLLLAVILWVSYKLAGLVGSVVEHGLTRSGPSLSQLLRRMIVSVASKLVLALGILIALSQIGISLGPLLAGLGIAGFVIGFALQDSLSNFASGLMILFYRPFDVGDTIEAAGVTGQVRHMSLVNTTIHTFDNQRIIIPNTQIWGNAITNVTAQTERRVDMTFGISYSDDIPKTERILREIVDSHELVLDNPEPVVRLHALADSSVNFVVRPWTRTENYWTVYWDVTRAVKMRFDEEGISIPFPQRDVHLIQAAVAERQEPPAAAVRAG